MSVQPNQQQNESTLDKLDVTDQVHVFPREKMGPDELYDLRREMLELGEEHMAVRIDIEYGNSLRYDDYRPKFTAQNLVSILMLLGNVEYHHVMHGNRNRSDIVKSLSSTISEHFRAWSDKHDVALEEYLGIEIGAAEGADNVERDHSERMKRARHEERDTEEITVEAKEGGLDDEELDFGPDAVDEKELHPQPQTPDSPDVPGGESGDDPEAG